MSSPSPTSPAKPLSKGLAIEYKAFLRKFFTPGAGTLFVIASCYYDTSGFTISFEKNAAGELTLVEEPPSGIFLNLVTYYSATWTNNADPDAEPTHIMIVDGEGTHRVHVRPWD
jgi:hypothetical protein